MTSTVNTSELLSIIDPVLDAMSGGVLQDALFRAFRAESDSMLTIEDSFRALTDQRHDVEVLRRFFQSWSQTNNSATCVAGLAGRVTLAAQDLPTSTRLQYYQIADSLQRVTDEDFGVGGEIIHSELFYRMATTICGDDIWLSKGYLSAPAKDFRALMMRQCLRDRDIMHGLLHTLIHEVYTHGEVEFILPLFESWVRTSINLPEKQVRKTLARIIVHTAGTEENHFRHATSAVTRYQEASGTYLDAEVATNIFRRYLQAKAAVMTDLQNAYSA